MKVKKHQIQSIRLNRTVVIDAYLPTGFQPDESLPILVLNDGQDAALLKLENTYKVWHQNKKNLRFLLFAVHASERIREYGVAGIADFKGRGDLAADYALFMIEECLPYLKKQYHFNVSHPLNAIAGFSLGGLSAMSIAWNYPQIFKRVGAFSASFWWRSKDLTKGYTDADRIMHSVIRSSKLKPGMKFWFQAGTEDETSDRNHNGIIDAIEDTIDLISELILLGYKPYYDVSYYEVQGGKHNQATWSEAFPVFLKWLFSA